MKTGDPSYCCPHKTDRPFQGDLGSVGLCNPAQWITLSPISVLTLLGAVLSSSDC